MSPYVLAAAALIVFILHVVKNRRSSRKLPPSPPSLPLVGHLHLIGRLPHRSLHDLHLRYGGSDGSGLLLLQLGRRRTLVACTAPAAAYLFKHHDLAFASRPRGAAADKLMYGRRNVSFAPYGEHWRRAKKVAVVHLLSPRRVESLARVRDAEAAALVAAVLRAAEAGEPVELRSLLYGYTNAVVTRATTGADAGPTAERLKRLLGGSEALVAGFQADDVLPDAAARVVRWATGLEKKLDEQAAAWDKFFSEIIAAHADKRAGEEEEEAEDIMGVLLRLREEGGADGFELTYDVIKAIVKDMIAAATETSAVTMEWAMAELVANPRVMAKLNDEIARIAGAADKPAATISQADLSRMEYLRAVLKEVLRLHPPAPLLVPHLSTAPAVVQGYEIPAGTALFFNVWAIGRDPAAWDAPEEFRPERFVGGGGAAVDFRGNDYQLIPFGAGRRICPGINFALPVVELALVSLLHHFEWSLPAGVRPADVDMGEAPGLTTPRRVPLVLVPRARF